MYNTPQNRSSDCPLIDKPKQPTKAEVVTELKRLRRINADLLEALERLSSTECFVQPGMISPECRARMKFAEAAIALATPKATTQNP